MKIKFDKLPTGNGKIQVSFDGGNTFTEFSISDIRDVGIPLEDNQDYSKIQIKGKASILKDLDVVKNITFENKIIVHVLDSIDHGSEDFTHSISEEDFNTFKNIVGDRTAIVFDENFHTVSYNLDYQPIASSNGQYGYVLWTYDGGLIKNEYPVFVSKDNKDMWDEGFLESLVELPLVIKCDYVK